MTSCRMKVGMASASEEDERIVECASTAGIMPYGWERSLLMISEPAQCTNTHVPQISRQPTDACIYCAQWIMKHLGLGIYYQDSNAKTSQPQLECGAFGFSSPNLGEQCEKEDRTN